MSNILKDLNLEQLKSICNVSINSILKEIEHRENNNEKSKENYFSVSTEKKLYFLRKLTVSLYVMRRFQNKLIISEIIILILVLPIMVG